MKSVHISTRGLMQYLDDPKGIVLTLPDGLIRASVLSRTLRIPFEVLIAQDLRAPCRCPCTIGAVTETGVVHLDQEVIARQQWLHRELRVYIDREIRLRQAEIDDRRQLLRLGRGLPNLTGRHVLFLLAGTSSTPAFLASIETVRNLGAGRIVAAIPAAMAEPIRKLQPQVDELVVGLKPEFATTPPLRSARTLTGVNTALMAGK